MKKNTLYLFVAAASSLVCAAPGVSAKTFTESMQQGSVVKINFRTRFEDVTEDYYAVDPVTKVLGKKGEREADAWTTRSRISYQSGAWNGFGFTGEMDNISEMTNDVDYRTSAHSSDPLNGQSKTVAVIADPVGILVPA